MKLLLPAVLVLLHVLTASACRCFPPSLIDDYFKPTTVSVVRAKVLFASDPCNGDCSGPNAALSRFFVLRVLQEYKSCVTASVIIVQSPSSSASCGLRLLVGRTYVVPLPAATGPLPIPSIHSCMFVRLWETLSKPQLDFLNSREICCGKTCKCTDGKPPVLCKRAPCSFIEPPCPEAASCKDNYCAGECSAEWFDKSGAPTCIPW